MRHAKLIRCLAKTVIVRLNKARDCLQTLVITLSQLCSIKTAEQSQENEMHDANVLLSEDVLSIREHLDAVEIPSEANFISLLKQTIDAGDYVLRSHLEKRKW